jgi:uncharacterized membrane protein YraQ (UPF0718 family)
LRRDFRVPGGLVGAMLTGLFPLALLGVALVESAHETVLGMNGLVFGAMIIATGILLYAATRGLRRVPQIATFQAHAETD